MGRNYMFHDSKTVAALSKEKNNTDCKAHELDNLYVVDTSFFRGIGAVKPALTAIANALRVGDHLRERVA